MVLPVQVAPTSELRQAMLALPGVTADEVLLWAGDFREHALQVECEGDAAAAEAWRRFAGKLEDEARRFPHPPKLPPGAAS